MQRTNRKRKLQISSLMWKILSTYIGSDTRVLETRLLEIKIKKKKIKSNPTVRVIQDDLHYNVTVSQLLQMIQCPELRSASDFHVMTTFEASFMLFVEIARSFFFFSLKLPKYIPGYHQQQCFFFQKYTANKISVYINLNIYSRGVIEEIIWFTIIKMEAKLD